ncbi:MAG: S-layer homology domain-containing protein [Candidatus Peribacteria bacterium]|nr:MAG: S-layer homology domain-containing protein [Candidatus Peribacteria bacterium]
MTVEDTCEGKFADLSSDDWGCKYAEAALANGFIAANANFRPDDNVSKVEALKMVFQARGIERADNEDWRAGYVETAVAEGIVSASFSDYDTAAVRGWIFVAGANAVDAEMVVEDEEDDLLGDLLGGLDDEEDEEMSGEDEETTDDEVVVSGDNVLSVTLSPMTPSAATIPGNVSGLPVAKFDFTAGSEDVTVTSVTVKRRGLSDSATLESLAVFSDEGRVSKGKDDSQENNTQAELTLTNGYVIKAGETQTLTVVADVAATGIANGDEFAIELLDVTASTTVEGLTNLVANTFKVGGVDAATLTFDPDGSVSNPKIGEEGVDIFKFKVTGASDEDVVLYSVTFKEDGTIDEEEEIGNFQLVHDGVVIAETSMQDSKYLTFDLGDGLTIAEDKVEKFVVRADILGGAARTVKYFVDKELDITAEGQKYGYGAAVDITTVDASGNLFSITVQAGELTLVEIDAPSDKIREDKQNVVLGKVKVTNVAGQNLELQKLGVYVALSTGTLANTFENFELYNEANGTSYELSYATGTGASATGVYSDDDLSVTLPQGTVTLTIRADTKDNVTGFDGMTIDLSMETGDDNLATAGGFYVEETADDNEVTDITPSSLTFKQIEGVVSSATASVVPLADVTVVRGAQDVVALQFEIEADEASAIYIDEMAVSNLSGSGLTNARVTEMKLYKGSVSESNLLDRVSGSQISGDVATFDGFNVEIPADETETFIVTLSVLDGDSAEGAVLNVELDSVSAEDEDSDDVTVTGIASVDSARSITVTGSGEFTVAYDANNDDNEDTKTILGGESMVVASYDVQATNEAVDVETVTVTLSQTGSDVKNSIASADLYLGSTKVGSASNSDVSTANGTISFTNLTKLIIPTEEEELKVQLNTSTIGYQKVGQTLTGLYVTSIALTTVEGVDSGNTVSSQTETDDSETFSIVPAVVTPAVVTQFGSDAKFSITVNDGSNTQTGSNSAVTVTLGTLTFTHNGNTTESGSTATGYVLYKDGQSSDQVGGVISGGNVTFDLSTFGTATNGQVSSSATYVIHALGTVDKTYGLKLQTDGVQYTTNSDGGSSVGLTSNMSTELDLGSKTF